MSVTKLAIGAGVVVFGLLCWLAAAGVATATELLVTFVALVVLIGGGNLLSGRRSPHRSPGFGSPHPPSSTYQPAPDGADGVDDEPGTSGEAGDPGARGAPGP